MANDIDTSADELARAVAALMKAAGSIPDLLSMWRSFADLHEQARQRMRDAGIEPDEPSPAEPLVAVIRVSAMLLHAGVDIGRDWQTLLSRHIPEIRAKVMACSEEDPYPEDRQALLTQVRMYLQALSELVEHSGQSIRRDIESLQRSLLPPDDPEAVGRLRRIPPRYSRIHE